jgi:hypothetical protein
MSTRTAAIINVSAAAAVIVAAALLHSRGLGVSLFEDEVWVAQLVKRGGWHPHSWATPPLFYALERAWTAMRGTSDAAMREVPAIFGATTMWAAFFILSALGVLTLYSPIFIAGAALFAMRSKRQLAGAAGIIALGLLAYFGWLAPGPESIQLHGDLTGFFAANGRWVTSPRVFLRSSADWVGQALNLVRFGWLALLAAVVWLARTRDRAVAALLILPPCAAALASIERLYPYGEVRLMIFCFPALYLAIALGIGWLAGRVPLILVVLVPFALYVQKYNQTYMRIDDLHPMYDAIARAHAPREPIVADPSFAAPLRYHHPELAPDIVASRQTPLRGWSIQRSLDTRGAATVIRIGGVTAARFTR